VDAVVAASDPNADSTGPVTDYLNAEISALVIALKYESDRDSAIIIRAEISALQTALKYAA